MLKIKIMNSFDKKHLEAIVESFLENHNGGDYEYHEKVIDTSKHWQFTDKTPLILHECIILYYV